MDYNKAKKNILNKQSKIYAGEFYSINSKRAKGHKGRINKVRKDGKIEATIVTHGPYTRNRKNIRLIENPQLGKSEQAFVVTEKEVVTRKNIGKKQNDMKVRNPIDKSIMRKIDTKK